MSAQWAATRTIEIPRTSATGAHVAALARCFIGTPGVRTPSGLVKAEPVAAPRFTAVPGAASPPTEPGKHHVTKRGPN